MLSKLQMISNMISSAEELTVGAEGVLQVVICILQRPLSSHPGLDGKAQHGQHGSASIADLQIHEAFFM